jgi:hypothetical protein
MIEYRNPYVDDVGEIIRYNPLDQAAIYRKDFDRLNVCTVELHDWLDGVGAVDDLAIIGFFRQLQRAGFQLKIEPALQSPENAAQDR